jgi:hypothetical protein
MLNKRLYEGLKAMFGRVQVRKEDMPMEYNITKDLIGKTKLQKISGGEEYAVCCPECGDRRFRLSLNHRFGTTEKTTGLLFNKLTWLAQCFNEGCDVTDTLEQLKDYVAQGKVEMIDIPSVINSRVSHGPPPHPGLQYRLVDLPDAHPAIQYLGERKFDIEEMSKKYKVTYCYASQMKHARNRIIFPVFKEGKNVGWQARYVGELPKKDSLMCATLNGKVDAIIGTGSGIAIFINRVPHEFPDGVQATVACGDSVYQGSTIAIPVPKYWTAPRMAKSHYLYNYDYAKPYAKDYVVIVEGPLDAIRYGEPAVAILGKKLSIMQQRLIQSVWDSGTVVIMLDPEALKEMKQALDELKSKIFGGQAFQISLPDGKDPGDCTKKFLHDYVIEHAQLSDIPLLPRATNE